MIPGDLSAKTISRIARALKVSRHGESPLQHIVQTVRKHFNAAACSLFECRLGTFKLIASDCEALPLGRHEIKAEGQNVELAVATRDAYFDGERGTVPLVYLDQVVGLLMIQKNESEAFNTSETQFLTFIALQLAGAIQSLTIAERAKLEIKQDRSSFVLPGIAVSSGFGIGPAFFLHAGIAPASCFTPDSPLLDAPGEWQRLAVSLRKTSEDLAKLGTSGTGDLSKEESRIFESHQLILSDPDFLKKLELEIERGKSALQAVSEVLQQYMRDFGEMIDHRHRETAVDLEDLRQRIFEHLLGMETREHKEDWRGILVAKSLGPSDTIRLDASKLLGIITMTGGPTSHAAILARSLGIPAVMGVSGIMEMIQPGALLIVDGDKGIVIAHPGASELREYELLEEKRVAETIELKSIAYEPAITLDGHVVRLEANVSFSADVKRLRYYGAEGIGLFRTEFLFLRGKKLPTETEQFETYRRMVQEAGGLPITFRTLDAGGDKLIDALHLEKEENPFLGYRSIRLSLSQPEILKTQFRAMLRASAFGSIRILIPMISGMEEVDAIKAMMAQVKRELSSEGMAFDLSIPMGWMVEVPAAVPMAHFLIQHADFLSIGTNDLTQYTLAVDRNNERVAAFFDPLHPAVLAFISQVAQVGLAAQKPVSVCGEMASDPFAIPLLVGLGISCLSMIPSRILEAKKVIRSLNYQAARDMAKLALQASRIQEVKAIVSGGGR